MSENHNGHECYGGFVYADSAEELRKRGRNPDEYPGARFMKPCPICTMQKFSRNFGHEMTWENWIHRDALAEAVAAFAAWYPHDENYACLLHGGRDEEMSGYGKTHLLSAAGIEYIRKGRKVKYWNAADLAENRFEPWFIEVIGKFEGLVLIDDLGNDPNYPMNRDSVDRLLDSRYRSRRPTIVAARLSLETIEHRYHRFHARMNSGTRILLSTQPFARRRDYEQPLETRENRDPDPPDTSPAPTFFDYPDEELAS